MSSTDLPIHPFPDTKTFEKWMKENHDSAAEIWVRLYNKNSGKQTISRGEALDVALCYGWIDSMSRGYDEISHIQRYSPRRAKGLWSKINRRNIERLIAEGRMKPAGLAQVEAAKADGRWEAAYDAPSEMVMPPAFIEALNKNKKALEFFNTLNKSNTYAIGWRIQTAKKEETKAKRIALIIDMLARGEKFH